MRTASYDAKPSRGVTGAPVVYGMNASGAEEGLDLVNDEESSAMPAVLPEDGVEGGSGPTTATASPYPVEEERTSDVMSMSRKTDEVGSSEKTTTVGSSESENGFGGSNSTHRGVIEDMEVSGELFPRSTGDIAVGSC